MGWIGRKSPMSLKYAHATQPLLTYVKLSAHLMFYSFLFFRNINFIYYTENAAPQKGGILLPSYTKRLKQPASTLACIFPQPIGENYEPASFAQRPTTRQEQALHKQRSQEQGPLR